MKTMRSKAFFVNGGAGRVISSIPAFEKYAETNDDFIIVCEGGTDFYKGHPTLDGKAYDHWHKNLFQEQIKHRDCVSPEPYRNWYYYNQKCNLAQAYDMEINGLDEPRELPKPKIELNKMEVISGFNIVQEIKSVTKKDKVIVVQPFGRSISQMGEFLADPSSRSMPLTGTCDIINQLKKDYAVIIMSEYHFSTEEDEEKSRYPVARPQIPDMRTWAAVIEVADHFLGCDSMGQHMARALDKTATVVVGSTYPENISYPGHKDFDIIDVGDGRREYAPIRITQDERVDRFNDQAMELDKNQIKQILDSCRKRLGKPKVFTGTYVPVQQQDTGSCSTPMQPQTQQVQAPKDAFQLSDGSKREPIGTTPMMTGAPKPTFTLNKPKPKQNKGFKNLLKSDKPTIDIETK
ncbi:MAG TPA: hypothetical protein DGM69_07520 [Chloroflexi bacterium]|nr:hypothetical protein [Chloroflexota bacterium]|tara:strand:- start:317 stop:1534 length:1218 start_codon:yes stop_codon:yes gene_type:complete